MTDRTRTNELEEDAEQIQLKGFSRTIAEIEWLLLLLCALYLVVTRRVDQLQPPLLWALGAFALFVAGFHYGNFFRMPARWKLALETTIMIAFITSVLWFTGRAGSPLVNAYLLVIIISSLALGKVATLLQTGAISLLYVWLAFTGLGLAAFAPASLIAYAGRLVPFWLVAYLCTMLADDMFFAQRRLRELAETDALTGLFNMRMFYSFARKEYAQSVRYARPLAVMMVDVDNLKRVNDLYGHDAGNRLIQLVADTLSMRVRDSDVLARYGGDEFALLLPNTDAAGAMQLASRIVSSLSPMTLAVAGERLRVTISVGVAAYPEHGTEVRELLGYADRAMYISKNSGKNKVTAYSQAA